VGLRDPGSLYDFLSPRADFWTEPLRNGTVDFMISPQDYGAVIRYFQQRRIPFEVLMDDVQNEINAQMHDVQQSISDLNTDFEDDVDERSGSSDIIFRREGNRVGGGGGVRGGTIFSNWFHFLMRPFTPTVPRRQFNFGRFPRKIKSNKPKKGGHRMNWSKYHRLSDIYEYMYFLQKQYPDLAEVINIGQTVEKRPMLVLKIGSKKFSDKPAIVMEGGIHAREWISPATVTFIINELVVKHRQNQDLLDFYDWYILPVANPDGYEYTFTSNRMWRKNRSRNKELSFPMSLCEGVDLNRNLDIIGEMSLWSRFMEGLHYPVRKRTRDHGPSPSPSHRTLPTLCHLFSKT